MITINSDTIFNAVKNLCLLANTTLSKEDYLLLKNAYALENNNSAKIAISQILKNIKIANDKKRPLCQDTGFITVFLKIGQNVSITGENINNIIDKAVQSAYEEYFLRKSIVDDVLFERVNTRNNTPVLIHTEITDNDFIEIELSVKGGGCENISASKMLSPADGVNGVKEFVLSTIKNAGSKPCPPIKIGIGIGSNFEGSAILSKKALLGEYTNETNYINLSNELLKRINSLEIGAMGLGGINTCLDVKILTAPCHIASLPVSISISCHCNRHSAAIVTKEKIMYRTDNYELFEPSINTQNIVKLNTAEIEKLQKLEIGTNIELSGKIFTARDAAHKKLNELIKNNQTLPFDINNAIIFYAGPCPAAANEIIGPIGPTTSARMDKFTPQLYKIGMLATIGKGERSQDVIDAIKQYNGKYFTVTGGVAVLLQECIKSAKIIAYPELGAEAIYELEIENLPLTVKY